MIRNYVCAAWTGFTRPATVPGPLILTFTNWQKTNQKMWLNHLYVFTLYFAWSDLIVMNLSLVFSRSFFLLTPVYYTLSLFVTRFSTLHLRSGEKNTRQTYQTEHWSIGLLPNKSLHKRMDYFLYAYFQNVFWMVLHNWNGNNLITIKISRYFNIKVNLFDRWNALNAKRWVPFYYCIVLFH